MHMACTTKGLETTRGDRNRTCKDGSRPFKLGWAFDGTYLHPGVWDRTSWPISGTGVCCHDGYRDTAENGRHRQWNPSTLRMLDIYDVHHATYANHVSTQLCLS